MGLGCCGGMSPIGLGQDDGTGDGSTTLYYPPADGGTDIPIVQGFDPSTWVAYSPTTTAPAGGLTPSETSLISNLAAGWTKIFGNVIAPQTTITTPQGLQVSTPAGQTSALSSILGGVGTSSSSLMPLLVVAGLGIAGLMLISGAMKK